MLDAGLNMPRVTDQQTMTDKSVFESFHIRAAVSADLPQLGVLAGKLVRQHHAFNEKRFVLPDNVERGYEGWFRRELAEKDAVLLSAIGGTAEAQGTQLVGYLYGRFETRDWNMLLDAHAALHDVLVEPEMRGKGVGDALIQRFVAIAKERGVPRIVLHAASANAGSQRLFTRLGFEPTMVEMTLELK